MENTEKGYHWTGNSNGLEEKRWKRTGRTPEIEDTRGNKRRAEEEDSAMPGAITVATRSTSRGIALRKRCTVTVGKMA